MRVRGVNAEGNGQSGPEAGVGAAQPGADFRRRANRVGDGGKPDRGGHAGQRRGRPDLPADTAAVVSAPATNDHALFTMTGAGVGDARRARTGVPSRPTEQPVYTPWSSRWARTASDGDGTRTALTRTGEPTRAIIVAHGQHRDRERVPTEPPDAPTDLGDVADRAVAQPG